MKRPLIPAFLAVALALFAAQTTIKAPPAKIAADEPLARINKNGVMDPQWLDRHNALTAEAKKGNIDLYFVGDSISYGWRRVGLAVWNKDFAGWKRETFGIVSDTTQNVLWRLKNGELDGVKPKVFVVMIGTNNRGRHTNEEIAAGNAAIIKTLQESNPSAKILLLGIFPCIPGEVTISEDPKTQKPWARINEINQLIAKLDDGKNVKYMDIGPKFLNKDGLLTPEIMGDGLHPSTKGYQIWADAIKPILTEWLGPPSATTTIATELPKWKS